MQIVRQRDLKVMRWHNSAFRREIALFLKSLALFIFLALMSWVFFHGRMAWPNFDWIEHPLQKYSHLLLFIFLVSYLPLRVISQLLEWPLPRARQDSRLLVLLGFLALSTGLINYLYELVAE